MPTISKKVFLTFPQKIIKEPIVYDLGHKFDVVTNIRGASVSDEIGLVALELEGEEAEVEAALTYLREKEVKVELMGADD